MIKRGCVYWDVFTSSKGTPKRVPVLIVSNDANNAHSGFVNTVRLAASAIAPHPSHVEVPADAWLFSKEITDCVIRCETVSVTKASDLYGPIAQIRPEYMEQVQRKITAHLGMAPRQEQTDFEAAYENMAAERQTNYGYSAARSPQARQTFPQTPVMPRPYTYRHYVDYDHQDSQIVTRVAPDAFNDSITRMYGPVEMEAKP